MRFFTRAWCNLEYDDAHTARVLRDYRRYLDHVRGHLPPTVRAFVRDVHVHDGLFRRVVLQPSERRLRITLRCGDLQGGYYDVDMMFEGVSLGKKDRRQLRLVSNRKGTEVLDDEVDITEEDETFEYRFICWPEGEVSIRFQRFAYEKTPVKARAFVAANPRFRVVE